ncbi:site-specific integrase, partial [Roseomonas harenae]|uniref:site-specific integrase n=1 Tax=Muricoccus harenae TaxID=2692566 RepID=UPI0013315778
PEAWESFQLSRNEIRDRLIARGDSPGLSGIDDLLGDALREGGTVVPTDEATVAVLRPAFHEAFTEVQRVIDCLIMAKRNDPQQPESNDGAGSSPPPCRAPFDAGPATAAEVDRDGLRLSDLADAYLTGCNAEPDYAGDLRTYVRRLQESLGGDGPVQQISRRDVVRFRDQVRKLPARPTHAQRRMPILELVEVAERERAEGIGRPRLTSKTVKKWLDHLGAMFWYGLTNELCTANPVAGVKPPKERDPEPPRQPFSQDELRLIFASPLYQGHAGDAYRCTPGTRIIRDSKFWLPFLGLYTGCRREEMAQARVADVKSEDGVAFLHITSVAQDNGREKRLKTFGARRMVPLHRAVLAAGFMEHVAERRRQGEIYLFSDLNHTAREPAGAFGKWFDRFCRRLVEMNGLPLGQGIDHPSRTFHSFRHTFKRACRDAEIGKELHDELTGHVGGDDVGQGYGRTSDGRFSLRVLNSAVQRIDYSGFVAPP